VLCQARLRSDSIARSHRLPSGNEEFLLARLNSKGFAMEANGLTELAVSAFSVWDIGTFSGIARPVPSYSMAVPVPLFSTQIGVAPKAWPHGFNRFGS